MASTTLINLDKEVYNFFANLPYNKSLEGIALAVIILYSSTFALHLPAEVLQFMASTPAKIAAIAFILAIANKKPILSLALAVGIFASLNAAQHRGIWEQFDVMDTPKNGYDVMPFRSAERIVPGPALKDAMFKARQRVRLEKTAGVLKDDNLFQTAPYGFDISN